MVDYVTDLARQLGDHGVTSSSTSSSCSSASRCLAFSCPAKHLVVASGFIARSGALDLRLLIPIVAIAAVVGDSIGFELGRRLGRGWLQYYGHWFGVRETHLVKVDGYFLRHGGKSVFFSHFLHLLRALMPFMAGASGMPYSRFAFYNTLGCVLWASTFAVLGYFFGQSWELLHRWAGRAGAVLGALLLLLLILGSIWGWIVRNELELRKRWQRFLQRPRVAETLRQLNERVDFLCRKLTPAGYLALHLLAGASFIIAFTWCFGAIASNASSHHYLLALDHKILAWFSEHATRSLIDFATRLAYFGSSPFLTIASLITGLILITRKSWDHLLLLFLAMAGGALLCLLLRISHWPLPLLENSLAVLPSERFPSWHSMGSTLFCGFLTALVGTTLVELRWRALILLIACVVVLLIALTRIYLGAHYVTDVVGAIAAGLAWLIWCQLGIALMQRALSLATPPVASGSR